MKSTRIRIPSLIFKFFFFFNEDTQKNIIFFKFIKILAIFQRNGWGDITFETENFKTPGLIKYV